MLEVALIACSLYKRGGLERVVKLKTDALASKYKINLILMYKNGEPAYSLNNEIKIYYLNYKYIQVRKCLINNIIKLKNIIRKNNIKLIIIEGRSVNFIPLLLRFFCKVKIVFVDHGSLKGYEVDKNTIKQKICNAIDQFLIKYLSDKIVTLTEREKQEYKKRFNIKDKKILTIHNPVDEKLLKNQNKYQINSKQIITVGRMDYAKGYEYLIKVAKVVLTKHPDWQWHIYGDGEENYKNKIIDLIKQNKLENHIILQGNHSDIYDLYQNYSFYVMTSRYEGLPMVLLEAKAKKLPIVSFDINSGPSDIIRDGVDGFLIKSFDCGVMAEKICELIENPDLRQKLSDNAHGNLDKFSKDKIIKQWCDLIDSLC